MITFGRAAAAVSSAAIANNIGLIRKMVGPSVRIMAVVKANGYGHGIYEVSRAALDAGADWLGVATVTEGIFLRRWNIMVPILVLSPAFEEEFENIILNNLASTIFSLDTAKKLAHVAGYLERTAKVHIKIDTGMNRVGYTGNAAAIAAEIAEIARLEGIVAEGIYSHFAASDSNPNFTREQFARFEHIIGTLEDFGLHIPIKHISNSGGILGYPECNLDMVRSGILTYGLAPNSLSEGAGELARLGFVPALTLKSRVAHVKTVKAGESVGYSRNFTAPRDLRVATVPLGYGDGLSRKHSNRGRVLINGIFCDIIGNICMDQFMIDTTEIDAKVRDEVIIIGESGKNRIWAEDVAERMESINYEVVTSISERVARFYV
jgi:alanine racemase